MGRPKGSKNKVSSIKKIKKTKGRKPRSDIGVPRKAKGVAPSPAIFKEEMAKKLSLNETPNAFKTEALPVFIDQTDGTFKVGDLIEKKPECIVGIECTQGKIVWMNKDSNFVRVEWKDHASFCVHKDTIKLR